MVAGGVGAAKATPARSDELGEDLADVLRDRLLTAYLEGRRDDASVVGVEAADGHSAATGVGLVPRGDVAVLRLEAFLPADRETSDLLNGLARRRDACS
jgi:hypothetical protein